MNPDVSPLPINPNANVLPPRDGASPPSPSLGAQADQSVTSLGKETLGVDLPTERKSPGEVPPVCPVAVSPPSDALKKVDKQRHAFLSRLVSCCKRKKASAESSNKPRFNISGWFANLKVCCHRKSATPANRQKALLQAEYDANAKGLILIKGKSADGQGVESDKHFKEPRVSPPGERFLQFFDKKSAMTKGSTYIDVKEGPHEDLTKDSLNLDAGYTRLAKNGKGGLVTSGDGCDRGYDAAQDEQIAVAAKIAVKFLGDLMMNEDNPDRLVQQLPGLVYQTDAHLRDVNRATGSQVGATNLAGVRVFPVEEGFRLVGVSAGNQRVMVTDAKTGRTIQLNNAQGAKDDCYVKSALAFKEPLQKEDIETIDVPLPNDFEPIIWIATDGAWENFDKTENPLVVDCEKLTAAIKSYHGDQPLNSKNLIESLTQHIKEKSVGNRALAFQINQEDRELDTKTSRLANLMSDNRPTLPPRTEIQRLLKDFYGFARNASSRENAELALDCISGLRQKIAENPEQESEEAIKGYLQYIDAQLEHLIPCAELQKQKMSSMGVVEWVNRALDDATITALSPFSIENE